MSVQREGTGTCDVLAVVKVPTKHNFESTPQISPPLPPPLSLVRADFLSCRFYDIDILIPLTDILFVGGDVLVLAGEATFTGCAVYETMGLASVGTIGYNFAVFGGVAIFTWCRILSVGITQQLAGAGTAVFVGGKRPQDKMRMPQVVH